MKIFEFTWCCLMIGGLIGLGVLLGADAPAPELSPNLQRLWKQSSLDMRDHLAKNPGALNGWDRFDQAVYEFRWALGKNGRTAKEQKLELMVATMMLADQHERGGR